MDARRGVSYHLTFSGRRLPILADVMVSEGPGRKALGERRDLDEPRWLSTAQAARRLGVTTRTLYRFIDEGQVPAYKFGRVIRLKQDEVDEFVERARIAPGSLEHLYPDTRHDTSDTDASLT
jgi:excisionase family DNA binding protein